MPEYVEQLLARIKQLTEANSQLLGVNDDLQKQLEQLADPLISYGEDVHRATLNARAIRGISLQQETEIQEYGLIAYLGRYGVMLDDVRVTDWLPPAAAIKELAQAVGIWKSALQVPLKVTKP